MPVKLRHWLQVRAGLFPLIPIAIFGFGFSIEYAICRFIMHFIRSFSCVCDYINMTKRVLKCFTLNDEDFHCGFD